MSTFTAEEWRTPKMDFKLAPIGIGVRTRNVDMITSAAVTTDDGAGTLGVASWISLAMGQFYMTSDVLHTYKWDSTLLELTVRKVTGNYKTEETVIINPPVPAMGTFGGNWAPAILTDAAYDIDNFATVIDNVIYYCSTDGNIYGYDLSTGTQVLNFYVARWATFFPSTEFLPYSSSSDMMMLKLLNVGGKPHLVYQMGGHNLAHGLYTCETSLYDISANRLVYRARVTNPISGVLSFANFGSLLPLASLITFDDHNYHCHLLVADNSVLFPRWGVVNGVFYNEVDYSANILSKYRIGLNGEANDPVAIGWPNLIIGWTYQGNGVDRIQCQDIYSLEWYDGFVYRPDLDIHLGYKYNAVDNDPISFKAVPTKDIISGAVNIPFAYDQNITSGNYRFMIYRNVVGALVNYAISFIASDLSEARFFESSMLFIPSDSIPKSTQPTGNYMRYA